MGRLRRKGSLLRTSWAELNTIGLAIMGFVLALSIKSPEFSYLVVVICGFMCGRLIFRSKNVHLFPSYMMVFGFFVGYIVGSYYTSRKMLLFIAVISIVVSYYVHDRGLV